MADTTTETVQLNLQLINVELLGINISSIDKPTDLGLQVLFQIAIEQRIDLAQKVVSVLTQISIVSKDDPSKIYGNLTTSCSFRIDEMGDYLDNETTKVNLPEQAAITLNSISLSTTRGIMYSEFRGTHLHGAVLPIVDPRQFAKPEQALG